VLSSKTAQVHALPPPLVRPSHGLALVLCLIAYFSLYPWQILDVRTPILRGFEPFDGRTPYVDAVINVFFYVPVGWVAALLHPNGRIPLSTASRLTVLGAALSLGMETIQAWVPGRDSTIQDVYINVAGTAIGVLTAPVLARHLATAGRRIAFREPHAVLPLALVSAWLIGQWFPFLPILHVSRFNESLSRLFRTAPLDWIDFLGAITTALLLSRLVRASLSPPAWQRALWIIAFVMPAQLFLVVQAPPWPLILISWFALLFSAVVAARLRHEDAWLVAITMVWIGARCFFPFHFGWNVGVFHWMPFTAFVSRGGDDAIRLVCNNVFLYGATLWLLHKIGLAMREAAIVLAGFLFVGEMAQLRLPGRISESTDIVLTIILAGVLARTRDHSRVS
jgi:VanZ family protein